MKASAILIFAFSFASCSEYLTDLKMSPCNNPVSENFSKGKELEATLQSLVNNGVPGIVMSVYSNEGWWHTAKGFAKLEDKTPMQPCHLQYLQSVAKTYMAIGILKLREQGRIDLDANITQYLKPDDARKISDAKRITVRMLLNHTSGIPEYNLVPKYVTKLLQEPDYYFTPSQYLKYIDGKPLNYEPGSKYTYTNTNYLLLAMIADEITGDHARYLSEIIFEPLGLSNTFYRNDGGYLNYPQLVNSYWDRYSNSILENASRLQRGNVRALIGDDGIVATAEDAVKFLRGLMEEKIISASSLAEMKTWVNDKNGNPTYGLGLDYAIFAGETGYGHSGGGIGAGCQLYYFPEKNIYVFLGINLGTVTDSPIHAKVTDSVDKIYEVLLKQ